MANGPNPCHVRAPDNLQSPAIPRTDGVSVAVAAFFFDAKGTALGIKVIDIEVGKRGLPHARFN